MSKSSTTPSITPALLNLSSTTQLNTSILLGLYCSTLAPPGVATVVLYTTLGLVSPLRLTDSNTSFQKSAASWAAPTNPLTFRQWDPSCKPEFSISVSDTVSPPKYPFSKSLNPSFLRESSPRWLSVSFQWPLKMLVIRTVWDASSGFVKFESNLRGTDFTSVRFSTKLSRFLIVSTWLESPEKKIHLFLRQFHAELR
ncbi:unnamed protein product [Linum trigynum]|uniref:Uncharacterized protein n=1 Tax=Linum trigynum TaxID=586398 RepID=A0AAV2GL90_9ROSI